MNRIPPCSLACTFDHSNSAALIHFLHCRRLRNCLYIAPKIGSNRQFGTISIGQGHRFRRRMVKNCLIQGQELSVSIAVPPLPKLPFHKFHLCAIHWNSTVPTWQKKITLEKTTLDANPTAEQHLIVSPIRTIYWKITNHPQNGTSKGIFTLLLVPGPQGKLMKTQFGQRRRSSIYQLFLFLFTAWKCFTIRQQNPTGNY